VAVWSGSAVTKGTLTGLGRDYLTVVPDGRRVDQCFIPLDSVDAVELL
jgi:hypothetical protein